MSCPDIELLVERRLLAGARTHDPWGTRFRIECADEGVRVWSNGKDRIAGTAGDVADDVPPVDAKRGADR